LFFIVVLVLQVLDLSVNDLSGPIPPVCQSGQLKHLILTGNKLSGGLPQNLSLCTSLLRMRLGNNVLTGSIPPQIGQMKNLSYFEADSNQLVGSIPPELSGCNLSFLSLSSNNLTGLLPGSLGQLKFLESMTVANNQLDGNLPEELGQIAVLQSLSLANNRFSGPIPEAFGNILQLNSLDLSDNLLNGSIPSQLGNLQELESLQLSGNRIVGGIPTSLKNLKRLFSLDIAENLLTGFIPPELGSILSLQQVLNLSHNALMGNIPQELAQLNKLVSLDLSYNNLSGEIPPSLVTMLSLLTLDLAFNNFSGRVPECIQCHKNFSASSFIGNPGLCGSPLSTNCPGNGPGSQSSSGHGKLPLWASIVIGIGVFVTLMTIIAVLFGFWHFWSQLTPTALHPHLQPAPEGCLFLDATKAGFVFVDVVAVTENLSVSQTIGKGRFSTVYKVVMPAGKELAVKCLKLDNENSLFNRRFTTELVKLDKVTPDLCFMLCYCAEVIGTSCWISLHYQYIQRCNICGIVVGAASKYPGPYRLHLARRLHSVIVQFHAQWQPWGVASWKIRYSAQLECSLQDCSQFGPGFDCNYLFAMLQSLIYFHPCLLCSAILRDQSCWHTHSELCQTKIAGAFLFAPRLPARCHPP
jgi:Leucine-rich repeat (LRR) protein